MIKPGYFILEGINSESIGMLIQDRSQLKAPRRKQTPLEPFGYSGSIIVDEAAYEDTDLELILWVDGNSDEEASRKREQIFYMFNSGRLLEFIPYWDQNKIYRVRVQEPLLFTPKYWHRGGQSFSLTLSVAPYKYYTHSPKVELTNPGVITNTTLEASEPIIKVVGSGGVDLIVNDKRFIIKNVSTDVILDSHASFAYRELVGGVLENRNDTIVSRQYPILLPGDNTISWDGAVSKVEIEPRWRTLI